jgi:hypothetical protein
MVALVRLDPEMIARAVKKRHEERDKDNNRARTDARILSPRVAADSEQPVLCGAGG